MSEQAVCTLPFMSGSDNMWKKCPDMLTVLAFITVLLYSISSKLLTEHKRLAFMN